ncbi:PTS mannitol transporter subunit IICBA [Corallincola spongiicola]|uniref:PTS system mannitol-specific EIICBA component n=1 Tax=Corallincola spongiicola TaxID=2520508 RepID=A0ABY1WPG9_9GAMM|nr:PTS mannitol transporter subunit IICBA [Corallincola spongiicola]TAA45980.1 PTS mannitol transporter subunit IICBA [Corallincola spongiicola]
MLNANTKVRVQSFGRFLSNMVMPNIGAFIAWGFVTALFIPTGWLPNETLATLVGPMITYLLPLLIGYTGGKLIGGDRGGVVGAATTMGVIVGSDMPMFMGAMMAGPLGGWAIKKVDAFLEGKVKSGFEMLVNNFSAGIVGMLLALVALMVIGPIATGVSNTLAAGVDLLVQNNLLPLTSVLVEPAKILFLNNAINHGVFSPLGIQQSSEVGQSIFFLIEANPGPGLGILLAYTLFGQGNAKQSAPGAVIIHFFGGIHEIYFPYVLMNPRLLIAVIAGGAAGVATLTMFNAGLVSPASPGSIIALLMMTPKASIIGVLLSVAVSTAVSFSIASIFVKQAAAEDDGEDSLNKAAAQMQGMKKSAKGQVPASISAEVKTPDTISTESIRKIIVACDAGMGSSAMGATVLRKKVQAQGLDITVKNLAINDLPADIDIVVTHQDLTERAVRQCPSAQHLSLSNFMDHAFYDQLVDRLTQSDGDKNGEVVTPITAAKVTKPVFPSDTSPLTINNVFIDLPTMGREQAIRLVGEKLHNAGFVDAEYADAMIDREAQVSTYMANGVAIPHGTSDAKHRVKQTGLVVCQFPNGITYGSEGEKAYLLIGIAAKGDEHMNVLASLADIIGHERLMPVLATTDSSTLIYKVLSGESAYYLAESA